MTKKWKKKRAAEKASAAAGGAGGVGGVSAHVPGPRYTPVSSGKKKPRPTGGAKNHRRHCVNCEERQRLLGDAAGAGCVGPYWECPHPITVKAARMQAKRWLGEFRETRDMVVAASIWGRPVDVPAYRQRGCQQLVEELTLTWRARPREVVSAEEDARRDAVLKALMEGAKEETNERHAREREARMREVRAVQEARRREEAERAAKVAAEAQRVAAVARERQEEFDRRDAARRQRRIAAADEEWERGAPYREYLERLKQGVRDRFAAQGHREG